jgi:hypothetical protein
MSLLAAGILSTYIAVSRPSAEWHEKSEKANKWKRNSRMYAIEIARKRACSQGYGPVSGAVWMPPEGGGVQ